MKIHELARLSGVNPETIRMYRQKGLLHPAKLANGYFDYSACNLYELMFVRKLRGANLGLETIASFYAEDGQAGALRNMKQEIRALEEAIRELEQRKKQLMSTLGHYVLFSNQPQQVQELTLRSECWFVPLELEPADSVCRRWMEHADALFTGIRIAVVNAIGTAVFAAFVGGGGLGGVITQAIRISDMSLILAATGVLMVIAVVLDWMISFPKLRERLAALALLAAVVAGVNAGSFAAAHSGAFRKAQPGDEIPKTHWIMMGLAGNGGYNNEDYVLTFSAPDGETRKALIRDEIAARLKEMGPAGLVRHALDKIGYTWGEGTYYLPHKLAMGPTQPHSFWAEIFFEGRAHFSLFLRYANGLMLCMLLYLLAGALQKQSRDVLFAARLSVCGLFFFLLTWEARSRYLVNYVPVLLLLFAAAAWGMAGRLPGQGCKQRGTGGESMPG